MADDIEITPEMLSAGSNELSGSARDLVEGWANSSEVAEAVFRAMWQARRLASSDGRPLLLDCVVKEWTAL